MRKTILRVLLVAVFPIVILACALQVVATTPNANPISTAAAQTLAVLTPTTSGPGIPVTGNDPPNPTVTMVTPVTMTSVVLITNQTITPMTPSPTVDVTSTLPVTPGVVQVRVNAPTNCRAGPSLAYDKVWALEVNNIADVIGRNETGNYWLIRNPNRPAETCWIWGRYATLIGDTNTVLPVYTPPPVNKVGFDASYSGLESCAGTGWWVGIKLENTGRLSFKSINITVRDTDRGVTLNQYTNGFGYKSDCVGFQARDELPPETSFVVSSPAFTYGLSGHRLRATINLCSEVAQGGTCISQEIFFTVQ